MGTWLEVKPPAVRAAWGSSTDHPQDSRPDSGSCLLTMAIIHRARLWREPFPQPFSPLQPSQPPSPSHTTPASAYPSEVETARTSFCTLPGPNRSSQHLHPYDCNLAGCPRQWRRALQAVATRAGRSASSRFGLGSRPPGKRLPPGQILEIAAAFSWSDCSNLPATKTVAPLDNCRAIL